MDFQNLPVLKGNGSYYYFSAFECVGIDQNKPAFAVRDQLAFIQIMPDYLIYFHKKCHLSRAMRLE